MILTKTACGISYFQRLQKLGLQVVPFRSYTQIPKRFHLFCIMPANSIPGTYFLANQRKRFHLSVPWIIYAKNMTMNFLSSI